VQIYGSVAMIDADHMLSAKMIKARHVTRQSGTDRRRSCSEPGCPFRALCRPFLITAIASRPASVLRAVQNTPNPSAGPVSFDTPVILLDDIVQVRDLNRNRAILVVIPFRPANEKLSSGSLSVLAVSQLINRSTEMLDCASHASGKQNGNVNSLAPGAILDLVAAGCSVRDHDIAGCGFAYRREQI
jgi:hypothetical protein